VAIALAVLIGAFNIVLGDRLSHEADNALFARAAAALSSLHVAGGRVSAPEVPDAGARDAQAWVFAGGRALERPPSDPATERAAAAIGAAALMSGGARRTEDLAATHTRLYAVPVIAGGRRLGTVVAAVSLRPYEDTAQTALIASLALGGAVLLVVAIGAGLLITGALRPVGRMTAQAEAWSEVDTGQRFGLGPPRDELTHLAATLDRLLDRVAASLRHEQRFSAELSHELRSPLSSVIAEAQLALRHADSIDEYRAGAERLLASAQHMRRTLDTLVASARLEHEQHPGAADAAAAARAAVRGYERRAAERGLKLTVTEPETPIRIGVGADVAERMLAPLVENACRYGRREVTVAVEQRDGAAVFVVRDDGPGVPERDREQIFQPGWRGSGNGNGHRAGAGLGDAGLAGAGLAGAGLAGAGLGLPLARRLARAAGGEVSHEDGARFTVRLPMG
jgi:signal transduction histidine kinase